MIVGDNFRNYEKFAQGKLLESTKLKDWKMMRLRKKSQVQKVIWIVKNFRNPKKSDNIYKSV